MKRPLSITTISWLFIAVGVVSLVYHLLPQQLGKVDWQSLFQQDVIWVCLVRLLAIVCGVFMLLRFDWARWLLVVWLAYHVGLSAFHSALQAGVHGLLMAVIVYFLFRAPANTYFRRKPADAPQTLKTSGGPEKVL